MSAGLSCLPCHLHTQTSGTWLGRGASPSATGPSGCQHCAPTGQVQAGQPIQLRTALSGGESRLTSGCVLIAAASPTDPKPTLWGHAEQGGGLSVCFETRRCFSQILQWLSHSNLRFHFCRINVPFPSDISLDPSFHVPPSCSPLVTCVCGQPSSLGHSEHREQGQTPPYPDRTSDFS